MKYSIGAVNGHTSRMTLVPGWKCRNVRHAWNTTKPNMISWSIQSHPGIHVTLLLNREGLCSRKLGRLEQRVVGWRQERPRAVLGYSSESDAQSLTACLESCKNKQTEHKTTEC